MASTTWGLPSFTLFTTSHGMRARRIIAAVPRVATMSKPSGAETARDVARDGLSWSRTLMNARRPARARSRRGQPMPIASMPCSNARANVSAMPITSPGRAHLGAEDGVDPGNFWNGKTLSFTDT
jgi:hypothetical protein